MYPVLFRIGEFEITSFGVLVGIGALVGMWMFTRELRHSGLPSDAADAAVAGVIGGLIGAKLLWTVEFSGDAPVTDLLFSRGGLSWFGGLLGGVGTGLWMLRRRRVPIVGALAAATPALAVGHAIGRLGCFMVGDDYGRPSDVPWAVAFPEGRPPTTVPVHPTQLYESLALAVIAWALIRWRRQGVADPVVLGRYFILAGSTRFAIEFIRVNLRIVGPADAGAPDLTRACRHRRNVAVPPLPGALTRAHQVPSRAHTRSTPGRRETCCGSEPCERRVARDRRETASAEPSPAQVTDSHGPAPAVPVSRSRGFPRRRAVRRAACLPLPITKGTRRQKGRA